MSFKTILIALILLVVVGGGLGAWYFLQPQSPAQTGTQVQSGGLPSTPGVGGNSTTQTQSQPDASSLSDIEAAYTALFQTLKAQKIAFAAVSASSTGNVTSIYALYTSDIAQSKKAFPAATNFSIQVAATDLNGDGTPEALVYEDLPGFCGTGGCTLDIYQLQKGAWVKVSSLLAGQYIGLSTTSTKGFSDLFLSVAGDIGSQTDVVRYTWDGSQYQPGATVATWNGAVFNVVQ